MTDEANRDGGGLVIVTGYVTVYPSPVVSFTSYLSAAPTGAMTRPILSSSLYAATSTSTSTSTSSTRMSSSSSPVSAGTSTATPHQHAPAAEHWSDRMASLSLAAVILMVILFLSLIGYAIYQRFRGKCHACVENERQLALYKTGELKYISASAIRARDSGQDTTGRCDLEMGLVAMGSEDERHANRQLALDALSGLPHEPTNKASSAWARTKGAAKNKWSNKNKAKRRPDEEHTAAVRDPMYTATGVQLLRLSKPLPAPPAPRVEDYQDDADLERAYDDLPSPSVYSRLGASHVGPSHQQERDTHSAPRLARNTTHDNPQQPTTYSAYMEQTWQPRNQEHLRQQAQDDMSIIPSGHMRTKRRSRSYGGLPNPEELEMSK
ncbi:hypothetical protein ACEQ8H_005962 [Pleosporales sp. CAS-2024a]